MGLRMNLGSMLMASQGQVGRDTLPAEPQPTARYWLEERVATFVCTRNRFESQR
jgi:hypothetical protein